MDTPVTMRTGRLADEQSPSTRWPTSVPAEASGHLLLKYSLVVLLPLLGLAASQGQTPVVTLLGLTIGTIGVSMLWSRLSLSRVRCERTLSTRVLFPGELLSLSLRLINAKLLPLPWVDVHQPLPPHMAPSADTEGAQRAGLNHSSSLSWYSRITWRHQFTMPKRGRYVLPPVTVTSGDVLGLYPRQIEDQGSDMVTVYPRIYPVRRLAIPRSDSSGELIGVSSLQEDPTRTRGLRDYQPQDGLRRVHWKASAHHGELKVKIFEPAAISRLRLVFAADSSMDEDCFELAVSTVASLANYCVENGIPVGLSSNARLPNRRGTWHVAEGSGSSHLTSILETLTDVEPAPEGSLAVLSRDLRTGASNSKGIVVVTGTPGEEHAAEFSRLARKHRSLTVLEVSHSHSRIKFAFSLSHITSPEDLLNMGGA